MMAEGANIAVAEEQLEFPLPAPASGKQPTRVARWILPGLPALFFSIGLLQVLFILDGPHVLFRDSDSGWHIRNGQTIAASHSVPHADPYSYTRGGRPWFAWEWLSDVLLGAADRVGGETGVSLLAAVVIVLAASASVKLALSLGANFFLAAIAGFAVLGTTSLHWLARPHIFSWHLALAFVAVAELERRRPTRALYLLPPLACLWANMHGSFLLGPAILLVYAAGEWIGRLRLAACDLRLEDSGPRALRPQVESRKPKAGVRFSAAALASLLATFVNPYGAQVHGHILAYLRNRYVMDHVAEFRSFSFHLDGAGYVELFLVIGAAGGVALFCQRQWGPALLTVAMLHVALYSARHLPTSAVILTPLCAAALTRQMRGWAALDGFLAYSDRLRTMERRMWGVAPVVLALLLGTLGLMGLASRGGVGFDPAVFPVHAARYLEKRGLPDDPPDAQRRVFAADQFGGYLIYRFNGRIKVFIDGRSDFYGQDLLEAYAQVMEVKPGWEQVLSAYQVRFVLVRTGQVLASALALRPEWKRVYADSVASVFEKEVPSSRSQVPSPRT
jgi:hypothetical protein